jgi:hypothetical protein
MNRFALLAVLLLAPEVAMAQVGGIRSPLPTQDGGTLPTGVSQPAGGVGLTGLLGGIYAKLLGSLAVTGTFWQTTQPVSLASVPLPTGAATAAGQPPLTLPGTPAASGITATVTGTIADSNSAPFQGEVAMTVGQTYTAARSVKAICTAAGSVSLVYANGSTGLWQAGVGMNTFPVAATSITSSGTTASCTYGNLL